MTIVEFCDDISKHNFNLQFKNEHSFWKSDRKWQIILHVFAWEIN